jgi:hypothetical protein
MKAATIALWVTRRDRGMRRPGAQAEYFCMPETGPIAHMPSNLRFDQAVVCEGAFYANPTIEHFALKPGHRILIYGASGAIGTAALQLAKDRGAEVAAVVAGRHLGSRPLVAESAVRALVEGHGKRAGRDSLAKAGKRAGVRDRTEGQDRSGPDSVRHRSQISSRRDRRCLSLRPDRREGWRGRHRHRHGRSACRARVRNAQADRARPE